MSSSLVLHIGLEKTGTTSFQQYCTRNARALGKLGIGYPKLDYLFFQGSHSLLTAGYLDESLRTFIPNHRRVSRAVAVTQLAHEIEKGKNGTILVSSEFFSSRFRDREIELFARDFSHYRPTIIVVVRDHYSLIRSSYSEAIMSGYRGTMADYVDELADGENRYCRYQETLKPWEARFGRESIKLIAYQKDADIIDDILSAIVRKRLTGPLEANIRLNESCDLEVLGYVRLFNELAPSWKDLFDSNTLDLWDGVCQKRRKYISLLADRPIRHQTAPLNSLRKKKCRNKIEAMIGNDREWLAQHGIVFSSDLSAISDIESACAMQPVDMPLPQCGEISLAMNEIRSFNNSLGMGVRALQSQAEASYSLKIKTHAQVVVKALRRLFARLVMDYVRR
ncbi:hypothetical protein [Candidatus Thiodictyon syntrophicum]|jgi:hypothetical protein|uniref:hypothetical protein n=1 Tax=Candidatus Thiodictyon syntrophicum TaxID=1166950 RepID=UPI0012FE79A1|nr:hypothetical protein [Candidatus Thiodictyon syntrophicum]